MTDTQTRLAVGDTRPPALPDVAIGTIVAAVLCAHRRDAPAGEGWYTDAYEDVVEEWVLENAEATVARLLAADGVDTQQHSTRRESESPARQLQQYRESPTTEQLVLQEVDGGD